MRKTKTLTFFLAIIGIVLVILSPFILWQSMPSKPLNLLIMDKTVPDQTYREHKGLMWVLNQQKYVQPDGSNYDMIQDYIGFIPTEGKEFDVRSLPPQLDSYDAIYLADTYGVYEEEYHSEKEDIIGERSSKIYGGLTNEEIDQLHQVALKQGKTIIAEFNSMAHPTPQETREKFYSLFNLEWSGWIGRYFPMLEDKEVPQWARTNYEKQYGEPYHFTGPGYVLVDRNDQLIVLDQEDIGEEGTIFSYNEKGEDFFGQPLSIPYSYWFDIVEPLNEDEVLATYSMSLSKKGEDRLKSLQLPTNFPAVIHQNNQVYETFYFAGDFADQADVPNLYQTVGLTTWRQWTEKSLPDNTSQFFWKGYIPMMRTILNDIKNNHSEKKLAAIPQVDGISLAGQVGEDYVQINQEGKWKDFFIKGVNMGIAKPGTFPGETGISKEEYLRWFKQIGAMNANALRVYTIHPPHFYEAFYEYNQMADEPLYMFHGVWVNENTIEEANNAFDPTNTDEFKAEINRVIDLVHGNAELPVRQGHASGSYTYDISPYVLGWIFGIEWNPHVVLSTDEKNKGLADYDGNYIKTENASPFEIWLATRMDEAIEYETTQYKWQRPVSFTNWVTTDLLDHSDYEPLTDEDLVGVNPNVMKATDAFHSGIFASYHIYPYYPDVLNHDPDYINYVDHRGEKNNYAGYLNELKRAHDMPILVAEFGIPSSRGMTHRNVYGFNQGNHDETEQGEMIRHLYEDIAAEQYAGGLVFSWQDEWFKRTWNTQTLDNPDRRPYWSNAQTNEQQFGLLSFDPTSHKTSQIQVDGRTGDWEFNNISPLLSSETESLSVTSDERYLYIQLQMNEITEDTRTTIVFDTILNQGQSSLPFTDEVDLTSANVDFALFMKGKESARLMVDSYYDPYYYQYGHLLKRIGQNNYSHKKDNGVYHPIQLMLSNQLIVAGEVIPLDSYETGKMQFGTSNPEDTAYNSLTDINVNLNEDLYEIRIPWLLLNMKDPSLNEALGDFWRERTIKNTAFPFEKVTQTIEEIHIGAYMESEESVNALPDLSGDQWNTERFATYKLEAWEFPSYHERLKPSYYIMKDAFEQVDAFDLSKNTETDGTE